MLSVGTKAPTFTLKDQNGRAHKLSDYRGKWLVIYFYPKDNTPGCTKEACSFRDSIDVIRNTGAEVIGISKDTITSHAKFADRYNLPFPILADPQTSTIKKYESWGKKKLFGNEFFSTIRTSYIINPKGLIAKVYPKVSPNTHTQEIIKDLKILIK